MANSISIANKKESEMIFPCFEIKVWILKLYKSLLSIPKNKHCAINAPRGTNIDNCNSCALLLIFPPRMATIHDVINVMSNKYSFIPYTEFGQLIKAIETQDNAVIVLIPCEIINVGVTIIDKGLIVLKLIFRICTISNRPINKKICLEFIVGSSFLEIYTRTPQHIRISKKFVIT